MKQKSAHQGKAMEKDSTPLTFTLVSSFETYSTALWGMLIYLSIVVDRVFGFSC